MLIILFNVTSVKQIIAIDTKIEYYVTVAGKLSLSKELEKDLQDEALVILINHHSMTIIGTSTIFIPSS